MSKQIVILSPYDLKPGTVDPNGRVVEKAVLHYNAEHMIAAVDYTDGSFDAISWPLGTGWIVT